MATRLQLCIADDHLQLHLLCPSPQGSWVWRCKRWWAYLIGDDNDFYNVVTSETAAIKASSLAQTLEQLVATVQRSSHKALRGATLEVEVGGGDARVGLLEIDAAQMARMTREALSTYASIWVKLTWAWDPDKYIIRCTPTSNAGKHVVTAVRKSLVQALTDVSERLHLRFTDCKPAMVTQLTQETQPTSSSIVICVERYLDGSCSPSAQLVALNADGLVSIANVWAPGDSESSKESARSTWVQRLGAQLHWGPTFQTRTHAWPTAPSKVAKQSVI